MNQNTPLISICTPTFNRRPFIPYMIKCFYHQTYPIHKIEWIIIDDGTDPIEDLVKDIPQVKYYYYKDKMELGKKRNLMHSKCSGDIIIYMDDDDYYPPERVSHATQMLLNNPDFLIAGSSEMYMYFNSRNKMYKCGPYGPYHATAATFAFKKELLNQTQYNESKAFAEEKEFTKNYTIPLLQLDSLKTILVFAHKQNSLDKEELLVDPLKTAMTESIYDVDDFIKNSELKQFYMTDVNNILENYEPGRIENKAEILEQIKKRDIKNKNKNKNNNKRTITKQFNNINDMKEYYEKQLTEKNYLIDELLKRIKDLKQK